MSPKKVKIQGKEYILYYTGTLAKVLNRGVQTIRKWERDGVIPNSIFKDKNKRRMYTQEQMDTIVKIAKKCGIKQGSSIANTSFSKEVHAALNEVNKKYIKKE